MKAYSKLKDDVLAGMTKEELIAQIRSLEAMLGCADNAACDETPCDAAACDEAKSGAVLARSYGLRMNSTVVRIVNGQKVRGRVEDSDHFAIIAEKGSPCADAIPPLYATFGRDSSIDIRIFSTPYTQDEIASFYGKDGIQSRATSNGATALYLPIEDEDYIAVVAEKMDFRVEMTGPQYLYCGEVSEANRVRVKGGNVWLAIGIEVKDGLVVPYMRVAVDKCVEKEKEQRHISVLSPEDCKVTVVYLNSGKEVDVPVAKLVCAD